ncbi:Uncharacterised protein [Nocardia cyriacigeorgica]|uniref:Uncharacterized protein n=1 Tax=Nocardia cyriacigeorgica TaxID=135487 RepID=A0A4U8VWN7_9NOCA|nr:Uncharacterised protein [Nocardia cyriacigeorgica]
MRVLDGLGGLGTGQAVAFDLLIARNREKFCGLT